MALALRQWIILMAFYTVYLIFGAAVFYKIENELEAERRAVALQERIDINELLVEFTAPNDLEIQNAILQRLSTYCKRPVTNYTTDQYEEPFQWTFYHAIFFAFTVCSTLGYGNTTPSTTFSRYFMIAYAMVGMPVNIILYSYLGEYFGKRLVAVYKRYKQYKMANNEDYVPRSWSMIGQITLTLIPASVLLIFLPSCLFSYFEGWPYSISVYYSFVTLSTIGFGDFIPTFQPHQEREFGIYFQLYQGFVLLWFVFGLSYILMLIGFIARGMRSKRIARLENQLAENIKLTHQRIWHGVGKDVGYLRKILNEVYLMRFRPAYDEPVTARCCIKHARSLSCPDLTEENVVQSPCLPRKRAQSEHYFDAKNLVAVDDHFIENSSDVLARVVLALSTFANANVDEPISAESADGGLDLFSDNEILIDEKVPKRGRAKSLFFYKAQSFKRYSCTVTPPLTWSGDNTHIQQYINDQYKEEKKQKDKRNSNVDPNSVKIIVDENEIKPKPEQNRRQSIFQTFSNMFGRRNTVVLDKTLSEDPNPAPNKVPVSPIVERRDTLRSPVSNFEWLRRSSDSTINSASDDNILENTTIADLIRAIETAHINNHILDTNENSTKSTVQSTRRASLALAKREATVAFASKFTSKPPPPPTVSKPSRLAPLYARRTSLAPSESSNHYVMRQNSSPTATVRRTKFEISKVDGGGGGVGSGLGSSLSPGGGPSLHMRRRFSAFPIPNTSIQHSPLPQRRTNIRRPMSPLALSHPPQYPTNDGKPSLKSSIPQTENDL